ncbi:transmembrane 7 superfamily member 3-like [Coccinella septempunctata]|uniref:transmembrane 7 superfamily member 3-like n=1 Tax=Coccinella septempunctata TaxID=41139 RepID=UPI001D0980E0|nr:transmembrane 7 superfamily member 3-like [Coccinella septempunctata]
MNYLIKLAICSFILGCKLIEGTSQTIIDISSYDPNDENTHTFYSFIQLLGGNGTEVVVKTNSTYQTGFYIVQAHSQRFNISLSNNVDVTQKVDGYNVGLVKAFQGAFEDSFSIQKLTDNDSVIIDSTILIAVAVYDEKAPIPGGCMTKNNASPILKVSNSPDIITVKAMAPSSNNHTCNDSQHEVRMEIYHKYLTSQIFSSSEYYEGIISMLRVDKIKAHSKLVATLDSYSSIEELFSSYIGTGEVFAVLVYNNEKVSAYVPAVSYGEDVNYLIDKENEGTSGQDVFVVLFSILPFVALVIIYRGHALFHFTTFSLGLSCGTIISFVVLSKEGATTVDHTFFLSLLFGLLYGSIWLGVWYKFGIPLLSATLAFLHAGALFTSIIYHFGVADDVNFHNNAIYWTIFFGIVFMCWFTLSMFTMHGHILSCCFLGSYILMITTLNYWLGGNLQYIMINVYRRMFVPNFNVAIIQPPFQVSDHLIALLGILFLLHGFRKQVKHQRGKPPFPPHNSFRPDEERSPLLGHF